jgi:hypothetical protein
MNRRQWIQRMGIVAGTAALPRAIAQTANAQQSDTGGKRNESSSHGRLALEDYEPKSMLQVHETHVERSRFPSIDIHTHITVSAKSENGVDLASERTYLGSAQELLPVMDRKNIRAMVNLTGGYGDGLRDVVSKYDHAYPGRFYSFTEPWYERFKEPDYPKIQAQMIEQAHNDGARGLKILKTLGLYLRENITSGTLVKIDDPRFDPMWDEHAGRDPHFGSSRILYTHRSLQRAL